MTIPLTGMSQIAFKIENITISEVIEIFDELIIIDEEGFGWGPNITVECSMKNTDITTDEIKKVTIGNFYFHH
jgi:hypothetical protein